MNITEYKGILENIVHDSLYVLDKHNDKQEEYDNILMEESNNDKVKEVVNNILNMYKEDDTVRLVLID